MNVISLGARKKGKGKGRRRGAARGIRRKRRLLAGRITNGTIAIVGGVTGIKRGKENGTESKTATGIETESMIRNTETVIIIIIGRIVTDHLSIGARRRQTQWTRPRTMGNLAESVIVIATVTVSTGIRCCQHHTRTVQHRDRDWDRERNHDSDKQ